MPRRPNIPCKHPGCAALIPHGQMYCEEHKPLHTKDRAHAAERGYGAKWQRERRKFLESNTNVTGRSADDLRERLNFIKKYI